MSDERVIFREYIEVIDYSVLPVVVFGVHTVVGVVIVVCLYVVDIVVAKVVDETYSVKTIMLQ